MATRSADRKLNALFIGLVSLSSVVILVKSAYLQELFGSSVLCKLAAVFWNAM
jgi:hypothetical protein